MQRTKERILDAALAVYAEVGFAAASMQQIAREADVAAGTVHYHYPSPDDLLRAAIARLTEQLDTPKPALFEGMDDPAERIGALVLALFRYWDTTAEWYRVFARDRERLPVLVEAEQRFYEDVRALVLAAVGDAGDPEVLRAVFALSAPGTHGSCRQTGMSTEEAARFVTAVLLAWIETHRGG